MSTNEKISSVFDEDQQSIGRIYAEALLKSAVATGSADAVVDDLEAVVGEAFAASGTLELLLANPRVDAARKSRMIDRLFGDKLNPLTVRFLKVLAGRRRLDSLRAIARAAREHLDEASGRSSVLVTTAAPMSDEDAEQLRQRLESSLGRQLRMQRRVRPEILGGLIVRVGDTLYDASVEGRLNNLQRRARQRAEIAVRSRAAEMTT